MLKSQKKLWKDKEKNNIRMLWKMIKLETPVAWHTVTY